MFYVLPDVCDKAVAFIKPDVFSTAELELF